MKLSDLVEREAVIPALDGTTRDAVLAELLDALIAAGAVTKSLRKDLLKLLTDREEKGSTGFGKGVAVPHVKHKRIKKMVAAIGVSQNGMDFNALDAAPVFSVILLVSPEDHPDQHLQAMENIFSNLQKDMFRRFLRQSRDVDAVMELLHDADTHQLQE